MLRLGGLVAIATYSHPQHTYNSVWQVSPLKERQQNSSNGGKWLDLMKICHKHATFPKTIIKIITQIPIQDEYISAILGGRRDFCATDPIGGLNTYQ